MTSTLEERLSRIERLLEELLERLEWLETRIREEETLGISGELVAAFNLPAQRALEYTKVIVKLIGRLGYIDDISKAIVEALIVEGPMSIRRLERTVRRIRGRASRRTLIERIRRLESMGIVSIERTGSRTIVRIKRDEGED